MNKRVKTIELYSCEVDFLKPLFAECEYPWEMLPKIKELAKSLIAAGIDGYERYSDDVLIGKDVKIYPTATIEGPAIICDGTEIRPGAFIRGSVIIGRGCVIGNSTELKNCILLDGVQVPHYNYVGDSVLGNRSHMGAGAICSNLKADKKPVVIRGEDDIDTGIKKIGALLGDSADVGCGCVLNPGTVIGKNTSVYPLTALRGVYPSDCIIKATDNVVKRK